MFVVFRGDKRQESEIIISYRSCIPLKSEVNFCFFLCIYICCSTLTAIFFSHVNSQLLYSTSISSLGGNDQVLSLGFLKFCAIFCERIRPRVVVSLRLISLHTRIHISHNYFQFDSEITSYFVSKNILWLKHQVSVSMFLKINSLLFQMRNIILEYFFEKNV